MKRKRPLVNVSIAIMCIGLGLQVYGLCNPTDVVIAACGMIVFSVGAAVGLVAVLFDR